MDKSPFGKLPGELKNIIYELALGGNHINLETKQGSDSEKKVVCTSSGHKPHTALLRTCKQINQEASPILYHDNEFHFMDDLDSVATFKSFTSMIGAANSVALSKCYIYSAKKEYDRAGSKCSGWGEEWAEWTKAATEQPRTHSKCRMIGTLRFCSTRNGAWRYNFDLSDYSILTWSGIVRQMFDDVDAVQERIRKVPWGDEWWTLLETMQMLLEVIKQMPKMKQLHLGGIE